MEFRELVQRIRAAGTEWFQVAQDLGLVHDQAERGFFFRTDVRNVAETMAYRLGHGCTPRVGEWAFLTLEGIAALQEVRASEEDAKWDNNLPTAARWGVVRDKSGAVVALDWLTGSGRMGITLSDQSLVVGLYSLAHKEGSSPFLSVALAADRKNGEDLFPEGRWTPVQRTCEDHDPSHSLWLGFDWAASAAQIVVAKPGRVSHLALIREAFSVPGFWEQTPDWLWDVMRSIL